MRPKHPKTLISSIRSLLSDVERAICDLRKPENGLFLSCANPVPIPAARIFRFGEGNGLIWCRGTYPKPKGWSATPHTHTHTHTHRSKHTHMQQTHTLTNTPIYTHAHSLCCSSLATVSFDTKMKGSGAKCGKRSPARAHTYIEREREGEKYTTHDVGGALCPLYWMTVVTVVEWALYSLTIKNKEYVWSGGRTLIRL